MNGVSKLTVTEDVALVTFNKLPADHKLIAGILDEFSKAEMNIDMISQTTSQGGDISFSFTVSGSDMVKALSLLKKMKEEGLEVKPLVSSVNTKIQLYGEEMREMYGVAARAIDVVARTGVQVVIITTSEVDISMLCASSHVDECIEELEKAFAIKA